MISDTTRRVITAIVDEDQLSLAIGRNGQNVRLASQLIGWQLDLYSSRDWMERGAESVLFGADEDYEVAYFPLAELDGISPATLAALEAIGISSFFNVLDMDKQDFLQVPGIGEEEADSLIALIDELTVVDETEAASEGEQAKATEDATAEDAAADEPTDEADTGSGDEAEEPEASGDEAEEPEASAAEGEETTEEDAADADAEEEPAEEELVAEERGA